MPEERILFWCSDSPACWRVRAVLEHKGLQYTSKFLNLSKKEHKCDEVLAINPRGQLPTFKDGEAVVNESAGIVMYLENQYSEKSLLPSDPAARGMALQRFFEGVGTDSFFRTFIRVKAGADPPLQDEEDLVEKMKTELAFWDKYIGNGKFIVGDRLTLADIIMAPLFIAIQRYGATFKECPNVKHYTDAMKVHPLFAKTAPPPWADEEPRWGFMNIL